MSTISTANRQMFKRLLWIAMGFLVAALILSAVERKSTRNANEVLIQIRELPDGNTLVNREDILLTLERSFGHRLVGVPLGAIDMNRVERVLEEEPFVLNADAFIDAAGKIHIELTQREPILRVIDKNGLNYYLDPSGRKMPLSPHFTARVLVATGNIPPFVPDFQKRKRHVLKDLFALTNTILDDDFMRVMVEQVYRSETGSYTLIPKLGYQKIVLGPYEAIDEKLERLRVFYREGIPYEGWQKYSTINLTFDGQVVCKRR
ncbi:MAG: cell division protein FtsQ [Bacteroidota bacterium]